MFIDRQPSPPILARVIRLFISVLCALGLAMSPLAAANAAFAPSGGMPGCTMDGKAPMKSSDHSKMDCCGIACQAPPWAAMLPRKDAQGIVHTVRTTKLVAAPVKELASVASSGLDPPPRA